MLKRIYVPKISNLEALINDLYSENKILFFFVA